MDLYDTYVANLLRIALEVDEVWLDLSPGASHSAPPEVLHIVPAWNRWGELHSLGANIAAREALETACLCIADHYRLGAVFDRARSWAEETLVLSGADDLAVARVAAEHGQRFFWRWDEHALHLLEYGWGAVLESWPVAVRRLTRRPCPLQSDGADDPCRRETFGVGSPTEAIDFDRRRVMLICTLGCTVCDYGRLLEPTADPDPDNPWPVPSRHDPGQERI